MCRPPQPLKTNNCSCLNRMLIKATLTKLKLCSTQSSSIQHTNLTWALSCCFEAPTPKRFKLSPTLEKARILSTQPNKLRKPVSAIKPGSVKPNRSLSKTQSSARKQYSSWRQSTSGTYFWCTYANIKWTRRINSFETKNCLTSNCKVWTTSRRILWPWYQT